MGDLEFISCPYCGSRTHRSWLTENGYIAVKCDQCGFVYVNPRPRLDLIRESAQTGMHGTNTEKLNVVSRFKAGKVAFYRNRILELYEPAELSSRRIRWLDVGAGYGEFLLAVKSLAGVGSKVEGIEPCLPKLRVAQAKGADVTCRTLAQVQDRYDVVSLINVFSHLPEPRGFLREIARHLNVNGEMVIETGNGGDIPADAMPMPYDFPDHLAFAGEKHVTGFLEELGFKIVRVCRHADSLHDSRLTLMAKNLAKRIIGRAPRVVRKGGPYRSLMIRAQLGT